MKKHFSLLLLSAVLALAACNRQATAPAAPTAPTAETSAAAATDAETAAAAEAAAAASANPANATATPATAATTPAVDATTPATTAPNAPAGPVPGLVAGTDYIEIPGGRPFEPLDGKIEVVEIFGYVCPFCARFQPLVVDWKKKLPADVRFTYVPAAFGGTWDLYAHAFYAAQSMGLVEKTHEAMYNAIHLEKTLKGERGKDTAQDLAAFYARYGANPRQFMSNMQSFAVVGKFNKAKQFALQSRISGTPSMIVNGKYLVKGTSFEDMLRITDALVAQERAAQAGAARQ